MKVLIAAGGTGGHIYPGIAVAKVIMDREPDSEILFVGTARGLETQIVPENGFQLSLIHSVGLKNVGLMGKVKGVSILPNSFIEARRLIREFKPEVVVGAGGYVSGPVLLTAHFMGLPTLIMDSNALPGFTNRRLARFVDRAALTFDEALPFFGRKGVVTGNPVRREIFDVSDRRPTPPIRILVFGGSQGSRAINFAMADALSSLKASLSELGITHQTGGADFSAIKAEYEKAGLLEADIRPYITNIVDEYEKADLVICRAGATTCAEIAAAGKPALMIPLPGASDDHQRKNAEAMERAGAVTMILQKDLDGDRLASAITDLVADPDKLHAMGRLAHKMSRPNAAETTVDLIEEVRNKRK